MNSVAEVSKNPHLWLRSQPFDLIFFQLSGFVFLLFLVPYIFWGEQVVFPIYNFYLIFFGLPHNYLTWATIFPKERRKAFRMEPVYITILFCIGLCALIPLTTGTDFNNWLLSFISYYSLWHAYRQHHGICKLYDAVQARRTGDTTIFADRKAMNFFFGLAANAVVVWAFTHSHIDYLLSSDAKYTLIHPVVPMDVFYMYIALTLGAGLWAAKRTIYDRVRAGRFIPWPQILLAISAIATYIVPYFFIPIEAMPLAVAIGTMFHNFQYFGFVWYFERTQSTESSELAETMGFPQRFAHQGSWMKYFTVALIYSFAVIALYLMTPRNFGLTFIYFLGIAHYIIDGFIWRRDNNTLLGGVVNQWAKSTPLYQNQKLQTREESSNGNLGIHTSQSKRPSPCDVSPAL